MRHHKLTQTGTYSRYLTIPTKWDEFKNGETVRLERTEKGKIVITIPKKKE